MRGTTTVLIGLISALGACGPLGGTNAYDPDAAGGAGGSAGSTSTLTGSAGARPANPHQRTSLIWVWQSYRFSLQKVLDNANSFTHVSPALYDLNYDYQSGVAHPEVASGKYDGLSGADMAIALHAAGLKIVPLMYAGAGNHGTDQGIQNVLTKPEVAQSFITSHVQEALTMGYDGWNLDWEVQDTHYDSYGPPLIAFLAAFKAALHEHQLELSFDLGGWYVKQCTSSGGGGLVDLKALGPAVDQAILENYAGTFEGPTDKCPASLPDLQSCDSFGNGLSVMCATTPSAVSIGLITPGSNPFAPQALSAISNYGFQSVALWPDDSGFLNSRGIPNDQTWFDVLGAWLAQ